MSTPESTVPLYPHLRMAPITEAGQGNWDQREVDGTSGTNPPRSQNSPRSGPAFVFLSPSPMLPRVRKTRMRNRGDKESTGQASITVKLLYRKRSY